MATIAEQLAAAAVTDTLKGSPTEATWPKLPWSNTRGTFSASGWKPPGYNEWAPTHAYGGTYYLTKKVTGGNGYTYLTIPSSYGLINGASYRSFSIWLFAGTAATATGYQLRAIQASSGSSEPKYKLRLSLFYEGTEYNLFESVEVPIEPGGAFAIAILEGEATMWYRKTEASAWTQAAVGTEEYGNTIIGIVTSGYSAIDGTGSNPTLANFSTGTLSAAVSPPVNTKAPAVTGTTQVGKTLSSTTGTWNNSPTSYKYQWQRSSTGTGGWANITGATSSTYMLSVLDEEEYVRCVVTAENAGGSASANSNVVGPMAGEPRPSSVAIRRQLPPDKIAMRIDLPNGAANRWAEDEPNPENVISDIELNDEMPGGYSSASGTLARDPRIDYPDIEEYGDVKFYQPGVNVVWQGSLDKGPDTTGDQKSITPSFLGYQSILEDNQAVQVGFIDCDLSKWGDISTQRRLNILNVPALLSGSSNVGLKDAGEYSPGIQQSIEEVGTNQRYVEVVYFAAGIILGKVRYTASAQGMTTEANWSRIVGLHDTDIATTESDDYKDMKVGSGSNLTLAATTSTRKYARLTTRYLQTPALTAIASTANWLNVKVLGNHGLFEQGEWPNIGFTAKQMLEYLIQNYGQPLEVDPDYIEEDGFIIPQAWYETASTVADISKDIMKYALMDWFVYHGKRFEYRQPGVYGKFWRANAAASNLQEVGIDSQRLWRSIVVQYQDVDGSTRTVGPPGSGATYTSAQLEITDPQNPAVQAERTRRDIIDMGGISTAAVAIEIGVRFLEEAQLLNRAGSATLAGYVMDDKGILWPAACVKSGDWISFVDAADTSYRKIVNKSYKHNERSAEIDLDAPPSGLEALLERLQVGLISLGVS